jgi:hypothetical protein
VQLLNALLFIYVILDGRMIFVIEEQLVKEFIPISVILSGIEIFIKDLQLKNA